MDCALSSLAEVRKAVQQEAAWKADSLVGQVDRQVSRVEDRRRAAHNDLPLLVAAVVRRNLAGYRGWVGKTCFFSS